MQPTQGETEEVQYFEGQRYVLCGKGYYRCTHYRPGKDKFRIVDTSVLHRDVWVYHNGPIPKGYVIHHIDLNKANNKVENLQMMSKQEHNRLHRTKYQDTDVLFAWTKTSEGREAFKAALEAGRNKKGIYRARNTCKQCGKEYVAEAGKRINQSFCSSLCRSEYRSYRKLHSKDRTCVVCGTEFLGGRTSKYCSLACRHTQMYSTNANVTAYCTQCGKVFFSTPYTNQKFCSKECHKEYRKITTKESLSVYCEGCGKEFLASKYGPARFCSKECRNKILHKPKEYVCIVCHSSFVRKSSLGSRLRICGGVCKRAHKKNEDSYITSTCVVCGEPFLKLSLKDTSTCSRKCQMKLAWDTRRVLCGPRRNQESLCPICGKTFTQHSSYLKVTCSKECQYKLAVRKRFPTLPV